ncbi:hypothetical protein GW587_27690 [Duganella sp. SAP-35]|uniref:Uncharacterized protein n=2 Tax=Duganella aceris TaxID=2703883 RepID=A0ABX0FTL1_9BURK|nr:hypothetical protein [Duganella aceris]
MSAAPVAAPAWPWAATGAANFFWGLHSACRRGARSRMNHADILSKKTNCL